MVVGVVAASGRRRSLAPYSQGPWTRIPKAFASPPQTRKELENGRLAMFAFSGIATQAVLVLLSTALLWLCAVVGMMLVACFWAYCYACI